MASIDSNNLWNIYNNIRPHFSILDNEDLSINSNIEINPSLNEEDIANKITNIKPNNITKYDTIDDSIDDSIDELTDKITDEKINEIVTKRIAKNKMYLTSEDNNDSENIIAEVIDLSKNNNVKEFGVTDDDIIQEKKRLIKRDINSRNLNRIDKNLYVNKSICNLCKMETMIRDDLKYVCIECGFINTQLITNTGECNGFFSSNKSDFSSTRYGSVNQLLPQSSRATTMLGSGGRNGYYKSYLARMQEWYNMPYSEKSLLEIFNIIDRKCIQDNLPTIIRDRSKLMFKILKDEKILKREKPKYALIASCVYYSCKEKGIPKTTKQLAKLFDISITQMTTGCKQYNEIMFHRNRDFLVKINPITYIECINSMCKILEIDDRFRLIIINIANVADRLGIVNDNIPPSIAVSSIFMLITMLKLPITKKTLSMRSNISEVTISKTYKKLYPYRKYLLTMKCL